MTTRQWLVAKDPAQVAARVADRFVAAASRAIEARGAARVALAGGSTPRATYRLLATHEMVERVQWSRVDFFFGDERGVPPEHSDSNFRMACETLLAQLPISEDQVYRMEAEREDRDVAAEEYATLLRMRCGAEADAIPVLDFVMLGMGPDGHTASLFPGSPALAETRRLVVPSRSPTQTWRMTCTFPLLNAAREVVFAVTGAEKAPALRRVASDEPDGPPSSRVRPTKGSLVWILDAPLAAASDLRETEGAV